LARGETTGASESEDHEQPERARSTRSGDEAVRVLHDELILAVVQARHTECPAPVP